MPSVPVQLGGQNWVITPASFAVNESKPSSISDQLFMLVLTGVAIPNFPGNHSNDWHLETITISPDVLSPLQWAISRWSIPTPAKPNFGPLLSLQSWAPFAALGSISEKPGGNAIAGFAVNNWRPSPFSNLLLDQNGHAIGNPFGGIDVDIAAMSTNTSILRISYHITLIGKIAFTPGP